MADNTNVSQEMVQEASIEVGLSLESMGILKVFYPLYQKVAIIFLVGIYGRYCSCVLLW